MNWNRLGFGLFLVLIPMPTKSTSIGPHAQDATVHGAPTARADDVGSIDAMIKALYEVISGPAGQKRDWTRFRSLFAEGAHLIRTAPSSGGALQIDVFSPEDYIGRYAENLENNGFFEQEIARRTEQFAHIAEVFTTYESRRHKEEKPFARGINSIQLMNDGHRWWIVNIMWDAEQPGSQLPEKYLRSGGN
jgi:hypothetical protein